MTSHLVAVGDIHGQSRKLLQLLRLIKKYMAGNGKVYCRDWNLVFLGDYIDRGPNSKGVVEIVRSFQRLGATCLLGNHENWAVENETRYDRDSLRSYEGMAGSGQEGLFREHLSWFRTLPLFHQTENHFFVHAGVRPGISLDEQTRNPEGSVLLWIREPFLTEQSDFGSYIVHGHTVTSQATPDIRPNRCNVDTGAGYGSRLSAAVFDLSQRKPIHVLSV